MSASLLASLQNSPPIKMKHISGSREQTTAKTTTTLTVVLMMRYIPASLYLLYAIHIQRAQTKPGSEEYPPSPTPRVADADFDVDGYLYRSVPDTRGPRSQRRAPPPPSIPCFYRLSFQPPSGHGGHKDLVALIDSVGPGEHPMYLYASAGTGADSPWRAQVYTVAPSRHEGGERADPIRWGPAQ